MKRVQVVFGTDENYIFPTMVTICSLLYNAGRNTYYDIYIQIDHYIKLECIQYLEILAKQFDFFEYHLIEMDISLFSDVVCNNTHVTFPTYYRLLAPVALESVDKCIFLDSDILVMDDLSSLYDLEMGEYYIGGVRSWDDYQDNEYNKKHMIANGIDSMDQYILLGVTVANLKKMRIDNMVKLFCEHMNKGYRSDDQDVFNICCYGMIKFIPLKYNFLIRFLEYDFNDGINIYSKDEIDEARNSPIILHYPGWAIKPWNNLLVKYSEIWWKYARLFQGTKLYIDTKRRMRDYLKTQVLEVFLGEIESENVLVIYGFSDVGIDLFHRVINANKSFKVVFCDRDKSKWGDYKGCRIMGLDTLSTLYNLREVYFLISSQNYSEEIINSLLEKSIEQSRIYRYRRLDWKYDAAIDKEKKRIKSLDELIQNTLDIKKAI